MGDRRSERVATFIAVAWVDKLGRRPLLFARLIGMFVSLVTIAICFADLNYVTAHTTQATNAPSDTGVVMLLATQFFLTLTNLLGESGTFALFAVMCVVSYVLIWKLVPETKGKTLDEIQPMFADDFAG